MVELLKCKIHGVKATGADKNYEGSISIDKGWMDLAGILPFEKVHVWNRNNGTRHVTYAMASPKGSSEIISNGPAAFLVNPGDVLIIAAFIHVDDVRAPYFKPKIVLFDAQNTPYLKPV